MLHVRGHDGLNAHWWKGQFSRYRPGDICYLREPLERGVYGFQFYSDDKSTVFIRGKQAPWRWKIDQLSQMLMLRIAARTFCEIVSVRVERLQDISEEDAKAEGVEGWCPFGFCHGCGYIPNHASMSDPEPCMCADLNCIDIFERLWNSINAKRAPWESNPFVWVYKFKLL